MPAQPLILAVDATGEYGSLALARGADLVEELPLHSPSGFAHVLFGSLSELLARHVGQTPRSARPLRTLPDRSSEPEGGIESAPQIAAIDCFASASGPGSFTGVRVGLAFTKGLAEALGKPAIAVSNLRALASFGTAPLRATVLDARRGEVYAAVYDAVGREVCPEVVTNFKSWLERLQFDSLGSGADPLVCGPTPSSAPGRRPAEGLPEHEGARPTVLEFISPDFSAFQSARAGTRFENAPLVTAPRALAGAIARIAFAAYERGEAADPTALDANYVRRSDAELFWKEQ